MSNRQPRTIVVECVACKGLGRQNGGCCGPCGGTGKRLAPLPEGLKRPSSSG